VVLVVEIDFSGVFLADINVWHGMLLFVIFVPGFAK
jgi:hypothetical protein